MHYPQESSVTSYCKSFPTQFVRAQGSKLFDKDDRPYLDFLSGCGSVNYGHNNESIKDALLKYISKDGVTISMDMLTDSKERFINLFDDLILKKRSMDYKFVFTGPTGTNAVEAAMKIARKYTGHRDIISFTNGYHGCTLGSLSVTGARNCRGTYYTVNNGVTRVPFDGYFGSEIDTSELLNTMLEDPSSGLDLPAAIILETVQGEGGLNVASPEWLIRIEEIARKFEALLIVDEIQTGCGRCGKFFSFEDYGISPDIITMSKSLSGFGIPLAMTLIKPEFDVFESGEHTGTFRGNCHAFVTGAEAINLYWSDDKFYKEIETKSRYLDGCITKISSKYKDLHLKGRGMMRGITFKFAEECKMTRKLCFEHGLIVEGAGPRGEVMKFLPPLTVSNSEIDHAMEIVDSSIDEIKIKS